MIKTLTQKQNVTTKIAATSLVLTSIMIGTAAIPAHAVEATSPETIETMETVQTFTTEEGTESTEALDVLQPVPLEVGQDILAAEAKAKAEAEAKAKAEAEAKAAQEEEKKAQEEAATAAQTLSSSNPVNSVKPTSNIPTGTGAAGLLAAARAQIGDTQDCTALVERALRAIGYSVGDLGPEQFGQYGTIIPASEAKAGDIMMRPGHVAIYSGDGTNHSAVHGGWGGNQTVETVWDANPADYTIVRIA